MKIEITEKNIIITPAPKRDKKNGLVVWFYRGEIAEREAYTMAVAKTDIIKGQRKYKLDPQFKYGIKGIQF